MRTMKATGDATTDSRVDELRRRLRSLGYLDAGVDRFVLGPARASRSPATFALLASVRIGALAALLLGPAAALGLAARMPALITGTRDALVVALYLGALFGVGIAAAAATASIGVLWSAKRAGSGLARRGRGLSLAAGVVVGLLCLTYLTLWWQTAGLGWAAPVWTSSALAVAVAISVLLAHAVTVTASAVIVAAAEGPEPLAATTSPWWMVVAAGTVGFGGAALLLTMAAGMDRAAEQPPALTVVPSGLRVRVIAIDGFDARLFDELASTGRVPTLAAAFSSARAELDPQARQATEAADPARAWTTVATGQLPDVHGVHGLETRRVAGLQGSVAAEPSGLGRVIRGATDLVRLTRPAIASGNERRAKTFWEVAAGAGLRTVVVNWWATWPARADAGIVLSDRATLRLERGGQLDAEIAPADLFARLQQRWPAIRTLAAARASEALAGSRAEGDVASLVRRSAELDAMQLALVAEVEPSGTDLSVVYLPGLDIAQHALLGVSPGPDTGAVAASTIAVRLDALKDYYVALDRLLVATLTLLQDELVIVVTEPGRVTTSATAQLSARGEVTRSGTVTSGRTTDVAPTVLYALGVPISRDLAGAPLVQIFDEGFRSRYPVRFIATYGAPLPKAALRSSEPLDQEMIDRLRSLGYVR